LNFTLKNNNSVVIFSKSYYDLDELNQDIKFIRKQIENQNEDNFELVRK
jgi:hypothetical protein